MSHIDELDTITLRELRQVLSRWMTPDKTVFGFADPEILARAVFQNAQDNDPTRVHDKAIAGLRSRMEDRVPEVETITKDELARALTLLGYGNHFSERVFAAAKEEDFPEDTVVKSAAGGFFQRRGKGWLTFGKTTFTSYEVPARPLTVISRP